MTAFLYLLAILFAAYGTGSLLLRLFVKSFNSRLEEFVFSSALGLGLLGYSVYIIGILGLLYLKCVLVLLIIFAFLAIGPFIALLCSIDLRGLLRKVIAFGFFEKFLLAAFVSIFIICIFGAAAPPTGNDALSYHLSHPKIFVQNHKIGHIPFTRESLWPYLTEMFFMIGLILKSSALAKMFHLLFGMLTALAIFSFTAKFFSTKKALLASVLFYSAPGIFMQSTYAYVDLSMCFYSFVAFYSLILWVKNKSLKWLILSGVFTGLVLSIKILGALSLFVTLMFICYVFWKEKMPAAKAASCLGAFVLSVFLVSCAWYIRSFAVLGNPVYPFLHNIFQSGWSTEAGSYISVASRGIFEFLRLPWDLVMNMEQFGGEQIGVIFLAFLPLLFFSKVWRGVTRYISIFFISYTILWYCVTPNIRFAFINFAMIFILISAGFYEVLKNRNLYILKALLSLCILFNFSLCFYYNRDAIKFGIGSMNKDEYLMKHEREYPMAKFVNENLPADSIIIMAQEHRGFYFNRKTIDYWILEKVSDEGILDYVAGLRKKGIPVYLLTVSDNQDNDIALLLKRRKPVYSISRDVKEGIIEEYRLYKL
ncbi:MAG: phospholipid carrier-dependent glycosyltransferase [Candidatus Orphnella occulta]|nr:phospholipid carrier-dependent glycosyltransferase [Candidatus Orphnella occulta]